MSNDANDLRARLDAIERQCRHLRAGMIVAIVVALSAGFLGSSVLGQQGTDSLRVRSLVVGDSNGQPRIVSGAPIPNSSGRTGMRINDAAGVERLGISLQSNGSMVIGIDAPPGTGNDLNRERITLVADQNGGAHIRFLDRRTSVPARIYLDQENKVWIPSRGVLCFFGRDPRGPGPFRGTWLECA